MKSPGGKNKILFIVGPTAIGKTEAAVRLAKRIGGEIISLDSMQIYKGMDIITSKPLSPTEKQAVHHLIDLIPPTREYNVSEYRRGALSKIKQLVKRGKIPIFAGGTGLYMSVLIDGIFDFNAKDKTIRQRLYKQLKKKGSGYLYKRLNAIDALAAGKIHPHDARRIIRALEVFQVTGKPISYLKTQREGLSPDFDIRIFCLNMQREKLYERIDERVDRMFSKGLLQEVKKLLKLRLSKTAACAIGLRELKGYFDGLYDLEEAKRLMKRNSRAYAKRQLTWFRKDKRIHWIDVGENEKPLSVSNRILKAL
ncbi:MAG: tRNA (adenosine(37)-N6)-dimethylallyltransferase MiaA [Omnitrophica WOR_2 bacterium RBG_13_44_8b]|nr:MAG: tRNA (adenosine(37)-N6)-dimethylallyltransferase MiaA [Omnitrophica WOR_2 bacterium RBG_13_44_8b]